MTEQVEKKLPVRNLERVTEQKCDSYEQAKLVQQVGPRDGKVTNFDQVNKIKIFARRDGTFDVVWYKKIEAPIQKVAKAVEEAVVDEKKVHGERSKDRKRPHRNASVKK